MLFCILNYILDFDSSNTVLSFKSESISSCVYPIFRSILLVCCPQTGTGLDALETPGESLNFGAGSGTTMFPFLINDFLLAL